MADRCLTSADRGRHVLCMGDLNSLPDSLCMSILLELGRMYDSFASVDSLDAESPDAGITCDSPKNTWSAGKHLDERALRHNGKRLDYVLFRGPTKGPLRLHCTQHKVVFMEPIMTLGVSYSDHFGVEATFQITGDAHAKTEPEAPSVDVLSQCLPLMDDALQQAIRCQRKSLQVFALLLAFAGVLIAGNSCAAAWLQHGRSVPAAVITAFLLVPTAWAGTTALYDGVVWGEWLKRKCKENRSHQVLCVLRSTEWRQWPAELGSFLYFYIESLFRVTMMRHENKQIDTCVYRCCSVR